MEKEFIENILKNVYLDVLTYQINNKSNLFFKQIKKESNNVWGKEIIVNYITEDDKDVLLKQELVTCLVSTKIPNNIILSNNLNYNVDELNNIILDLLDKISNKLTLALFTQDYKQPNDLSFFEPYNLCGLKDLFSNSNYLYGLERKKFSFLNPIHKRVKNFNESEILKVIEDTKTDINMIICNSKTKMKYENYLKELSKEKSTKEYYDLGKFTMFNNNIPIVISNKMEDNKLYLVNTNDFTFYQLYDWSWLKDENNKISLKEDQDNNFIISLVNYGNLICRQPNKQIEILLEQ